MSNIAIRHFCVNNLNHLIIFVMSRKALVCVLTMSESSNLICNIESDSDSFLSESVNYSTESTDDLSVYNLSIPAEVEVLPYRFEPNASDSESNGHGSEVVHGKLDSLSPERVGNTVWYLKKGLSFKQACSYVGLNLKCLCGHCWPMDTAQESICCKEVGKIQSHLVGDPPPTCITIHPGFPNACRITLIIAWHGCRHHCRTRDMPSFCMTN